MRKIIANNLVRSKSVKEAYNQFLSLEAKFKA
jgi:hypothetical protein